jgi:hypothetical protein
VSDSPVRHRFRIDGTPPVGPKDTTGQLLDGTDGGTPGSDHRTLPVALVSAKIVGTGNMVLPGAAAFDPTRSRGTLFFLRVAGRDEVNRVGGNDE